jgi:hypothetical protein
VALVLISHLKQWIMDPVFALIIECDTDFFTVRRALHRPTPFTVPRSMIHSQLQYQSGGLLC